MTRDLQRVFTNSVILYQDDFYLSDSDIPVASNGLQDWDCPEAFDFEYMKWVLEHAKEHGKLPEKFKSLEETQTLGPTSASEEDIDKIKSSLPDDNKNQQFVLVDGIMLFHASSPLIDLFDVKLMLRAPYAELKKRREAREGYATLEGFWTDPPGYFDQIVWPGYVNNHKHLFINENVEEQLHPQFSALNVPQDIHWPPHKVLQWAVDRINF